MGEGTGGGVDTDAGVSGTSGTQDSSYSPSSYSSLGQSPGAMGGRPDPTPAPVVRSSNDYFTPMNDQPISGQGPVNTFSRYLQDVGRNIFGGGTQTDDRGPSGADVGAVSVNDNQFNQGLASLSGVSPSNDRDTDTTMAALRRGAPALMASNAPDFVTMGGGTSPIDARQRPDPNEMSMFERTTATQDFPPIVGPLRTIDARERPDPNEIANAIQLGRGDRRPPGLDMPEFNARTQDEIGMTPAYNVLRDMDAYRPDPIGPGLGLIDNPDLARAIANQQGTLPSQIGDNLDANKVFSLGKGTTKAKTQEELNILQRLGRFLKGVGKSISNFEMNDIFEFLKGDPNYKGPSAAQQQLMGVPGPGPAVGGGAPSPSGGGGMAAPAKDPCPPGFRFDPTLQQCVPIIAPNKPTDTTTKPTTPTTPATGTSPPAAGGIANAYPFTLTPPIGAPVGNLPPVRLTT